MGKPTACGVMDDLPKRLKRATQPEMVEVGPGVYAPRNPDRKVADTTLARWEQTDRGWRAIPICERLVRLDPKLAALMGFDGRNYNTLRRLGRAGFIEIIVIAPHTTLINLDSWFNHLRRCAENPEYWEKGGPAYRAYQEALA
jgi:hypothetical protein